MTQAQALDLQAETLVPRVPTARRVSMVLAVVFIAFAAAALLAPWQQNVRGAGRVIGYAPLERRQMVEAPVAGRVEQFHVREGSRVKRGDPLLEIRDNDPRLMERLNEQRTALEQKLLSYEERVDQLQAQIDSRRQAALAAQQSAQAKLSVAQQKLGAEQQKLAAAEAGLSTATVQLQRMRQLVEEGLSSAREMELAELSRTKARTERDSLLAAVSGARADVQAAEAMLLKIRADMEAKVQETLSKLGSARSDVADTRGSLSKIEVEIARQHSQQVTAPRDGVVLRLLSNEGGALVKPGQALLELVPDARDRAVEIWVDGNDAPLIESGRPVRLQFEGWPAVQFTGWPSVAVGTFGGEVAFVDVHGDGKGRFRVVVVPDPNDQPWPPPRFLRQGARVKAWVLLKRVTLGFELWRQFNGFPPVVDPPEGFDAHTFKESKW